MTTTLASDLLTPLGAYLRRPDVPRDALPRRRHARPVRPRARRRGRAVRRRRRARRAAAAARDAPRAARRDAALPVAGRVRALGARGEGRDRSGGGVPDRPLAARRTADLRVGARPLPRAAAHQPLSVSLPARAGRDLAGRRRRT